MKTYEEVAAHASLNERTKKRFVCYMRTRWADEEAVQCQVGYASEWAERFRSGNEYAASDLDGQAVLRQMQEMETA